MKQLFLLRHAKSSWANPSLDDLDRPLNKRGIRQLSIMAPVLQADGALDSSIFTSKAERAQQTVNGILDKAKSNTHPKHDKELYTFNRKKLLKWLYKLPDEENKVLVVGHNPAIEELVSYLLKTEIDAIPTCSYVHLEIDTPSWSALSPLQATVKNFVTPSSASYKEFLRKAEKEAFKAKYKSEAFQSTLQEELVQLFKVSQGLLPGCKVGIDPEFIHQYRVTLRRARSLGGSLYALTKDPVLAEHLETLKQHAKCTSQLRDLDVFINLLNKTKENNSLSSQAGMKSLLQEFTEEKQRKLALFVQTIDSGQFHQERKKLKKYLSSDLFGELCNQAREDLLLTNQEAIERKIEKLVDQLSPDARDDNFHCVRKLIKKDRYLAEQTAHQKKNIRALKATQEKLGVFQDLCVQCDLLNDYLNNSDRDTHAPATHAAKSLLSHLEQEKTLIKHKICS